MNTETNNTQPERESDFAGSGEGSPHSPAFDAGAPSEDSLLTALQTDLDRFRDLALRSQADFENFRKRAAREKDDAVKYANVSLLEKLIPIIDNFELGLRPRAVPPRAAPSSPGWRWSPGSCRISSPRMAWSRSPPEGEKFDPERARSLRPGGKRHRPGRAASFVSCARALSCAIACCARRPWSSPKVRPPPDSLASFTDGCQARLLRNSGSDPHLDFGRDEKVVPQARGEVSPGQESGRPDGGG